jgi:hypothetical protein
MFKFRPFSGGRRGVLTTLKRHPNNALNQVFQVQGAWWKYCGVWECVKVWAWDITWLQNECGVLICRPMVNSYGLGWALTGPLIQEFYGLTITKGCLYPHEGSGCRWTKWMVLFVFPCVLERRIPYLISLALIPSLCLCLDIWQMEWMGGGQSKNNSVEISEVI